jgi:hypothetical protein
MAGSDELIDQLEEQMAYFRVEQEFREILNNESPGPGYQFARAMAEVGLRALTGEDPNAGNDGDV